MVLFGPFPLVLLILVAIFFVMISSSRPRRSRRLISMRCNWCELEHPGHARFCRRCGRRLA
jgi:hypothetical protein